MKLYKYEIQKLKKLVNTPFEIYSPLSLHKRVCRSYQRAEEIEEYAKDWLANERLFNSCDALLAKIRSEK